MGGKVGVHLPACRMRLVFQIGVAVNLGKKLFGGQMADGHHKGLVTVVARTEISGTKNLGPSDLRQFFPTTENTEFSTARQHFFAAGQTEFAAQNG